MLRAKGRPKSQELFVHGHFKTTAFAACTGTWSRDLSDMVDLQLPMRIRAQCVSNFDLLILEQLACTGTAHGSLKAHTQRNFFELFAVFVLAIVNSMDQLMHQRV